MSPGYAIGIVGATGAVGREVLGILEERNFPVRELRALASARKNGRTVEFRGESIPVEPATPDSFRGLDLVFGAASGAVSRELMPSAVEAGAVVVDKTSAWRYEADVPLVVPEVNGDDIARHNGIIACPNCSTIQMVVALAPLHRSHAIVRVIVSTYQSVSGAGAGAMAELSDQARAIIAGGDPAVSVLPRQIAFNVIPEVESFRTEDGYTTEEWKLANETRKIMHAPDLRISATCVRVPVYRGHSEAVNVEFAEPVQASAVREILEAAPGVRVVDDVVGGAYPTALDADGNDDVWVGRIRGDASLDGGVVFWIVSDNLRKGAATNSVQIAESVIANDWFQGARG